MLGFTTTQQQQIAKPTNSNLNSAIGGLSSVVDGLFDNLTQKILTPKASYSPNSYVNPDTLFPNGMPQASNSQTLSNADSTQSNDYLLYGGLALGGLALFLLLKKR